ncbi:Early nodulin-like protein 1 [Morus notabilis]|uniref:Early nodulin-like protein 1 n=1 Tax=Morus notabilis TaxID=981085 RepID=W9S4H6_9ROSA|nr:uclacyanin 1 [Morus notabilis]EXC10039.1 Early nodulin-like protein 1 [Morus notabilis]
MEGSRPQWTAKASILIVIMASILLRGVSAANHTVGGVSGWDLTSNIQAWASQTTFHVGDYLVFSYTPVHDVLEVEEEDYKSCDISDPIRTYNDGETVIPLTQEGPRYFICGRQGHCSMGLKLEAHVLAANDTRRGRSPATPPNNSPSPPPQDGDGGDDDGYEPNTPPSSHAPGLTNHASPLHMIMPSVTTLLLLPVFVVMINILGCH